MNSAEPLCARISVLGLPQDAAHKASTRVPKSLVIRAGKHLLRRSLSTWKLKDDFLETRRTYRAVLSEPVLVVPPNLLAEMSSSMEVDKTATIPQKRPHDGVKEQGPSQNQVLLEWDSIWTINKKIIDPIAPRFCAIAKEKV